MKSYQNRNELIEDVDFVKSIILDYEFMNHLIHTLFRQWMKTSPDSPWYSKNINSIETTAKSVEAPLSNLQNINLKPESNLSKQNSQSIIDNAMDIKLEMQSAPLPNKFPLNDNNFLPEKFETSNTITNFILSLSWRAAKKFARAHAKTSENCLIIKYIQKYT